ncbi:cobalamin-dependent protein [Streptomyces sp. NPDC026673]|uniref:cobalamin B12-binding domain-containing protein n=1 Tax=Streptomyces sp. NPDC026673 TaxID=3155724 RepID=UPI0033CC21BC
MSTVSTRPAAAGPSDDRADALFAAIAGGDEYAAVAVVEAAVGEGVRPERILQEIIAPAQRRIGTEWAAGRITVGQEHAATAISERAIAALTGAPPGRRTSPPLGRVVVACVDGEWHTMPARLVAETLRLRGWHVDFLGAHVPARHLVAHLHATGPDAVALSSSLSVRLPKAHATITACQAAGVAVLAGGRGFGRDGRYALQLGADAWAASATEAADRLGRAWPPEVRRPHETLAHLADDEYTLVVRARSRLVAETMAALPGVLPASRSYTPLQLDHTAEDLGHITDHLAAALYVDDAELFTDFLVWTARILTARGVPATALTVSLRLMAAPLRDFPRTLALLDSGVAAIRRAEEATGPEGSANTA